MSKETHNESHGHDPELDPHEVEHIKEHVKFYWGIFGALLLFTVLTVLASFIPFDSSAAEITIGLVIAAIKAALVALFFMHLSNEKRLVYGVMAFTVFFFLGLMFLTLWAYFDDAHSVPW